MLQLQFQPFPEIKTERLLLRRIGISDASNLFQFRTDEDVMAYIDRERPKDISEIESLIGLINEGIEKGASITWGICYPEMPGTLIGTIGYWQILHQHYRAEIGYMLQRTHWRKGLMHEALGAVIRFGFDSMHLHSIEAHINPANEASGALLEKNGFVREGYFKEDYFFRGRFLDTAIYSLLSDKGHIL
ncbi:MAG: GNAT family N-acetyltransferase [Ferruginibacter sp.]